jgi:DNA-directed RNA polymerase subunit F
MSEERRKILEMLSSGKIAVEEAERLLNALEGGDAQLRENPSSKLRYLRVLVEPDAANERDERVNIRVPLKLIRAGLKWASFIPKEAQSRVNEALTEKGIDVDFSRLKPEDLDEIIEQLNDLTIDVEGKEKVRIFCE